MRATSPAATAEDGAKGKDLLCKLFEGGGELYKATGRGVDEDYERVLFCEIEINGGVEEEHSVTWCGSTELRTQSALTSKPVKRCSK